jgi:hypothetical protein
MHRRPPVPNHRPVAKVTPPRVVRPGRTHRHVPTNLPPRQQRGAR